MTKLCYRCKSPDNLPEKPYNGKNLYLCRPCGMAKWKKYYATNKGKESVKGSVAKYQANNPLRTAAWRKASWNIAKKPCEVCGDVKVHKHHPDVNQPRNVVFLCPYHHKQEHLKTDIMSLTSRKAAA